MKILMTGGLGYIGSSLLRSFPHKFPQARIIVLDNLSSGSKKILEGNKNKRISFIEGDILSYDFNSLSLSPEDTVIHLAGLSRPLESYGRSRDFYRINCTGALRTARACAKASAFFLFPSTTSVYHQTGEKWIHGCASHLKPQTPYAASKLAAEKGLRRIKNLAYTVVRFGTIYGMAPAFSLHTAVNKFCWQASRGKSISVWKTALKQYRPYLDLKDASRLIEFLIKRREFSGETFNAATNQATPKQILREISREQPEIQVEQVPAKAMNTLSYKVSRKELTRLGFKFEGSLRDSVREILTACRA